MRCSLSKVIIVYAIIVLLASCNNPVMQSEPETQIILTPGIPVIEEIIYMTILPIEVYEKYAIDENNKVFGLTGNSLDAIVLKDSEDKIHSFNEFFRKDDMLFFSVYLMEPIEPDGEPGGVLHYFMQANGAVEEYTESNFPDKPDSNFIEMGIAPFAIQTFDYEGMDTSRVSKDGKPTGFKMIDAYHSTPDGLWFSVPETIFIRLKGIYFYPINGNLSQSPVMSGKIW